MTPAEIARVDAAWAAAGQLIAYLQESARVADHPEIARALMVTARARARAAELAERRKKAT